MQVGVQKARQIAAKHGVKYIPVHHMEAHALIARAGTAVQFPYLCLLVSGGHNMIVIVEGVGAYTLLGSTLDDAVGKSSSFNYMTPPLECADSHQSGALGVMICTVRQEQQWA